MLVAEAVAEVPLYYPRPGVVEQENDDFYRTAAETVRACLSDSDIDPRQVAAISFSSQMAGSSSIDESYDPATRFDSWLDMRCQPYIAYPHRQSRRSYYPAYRLRADLRSRPENLWWKNEQPDDYARVAKFVMPPPTWRARWPDYRPIRHSWTIRSSTSGLPINPSGNGHRRFVICWTWIWASYRRSSSRGGS
ncbi:MAG: FGGY family carbohydrate kinase [Chloroflexota bacterium]